MEDTDKMIKKIFNFLKIKRMEPFKVKCISNYKHEDILKEEQEYFVLYEIQDMYVISSTKEKSSFLDVVKQNRFEIL